MVSPKQNGIMLQVGGELTNAQANPSHTLLGQAILGQTRGRGCMARNWMLAALAVAIVLTACGDGDTSESAPGTTTSTQAVPAPTKVPTTTGPARTTIVSERLAYWRGVVKAMNCPEVTDLELKRLAGHFSDRAESLVAIHDRQGELNCA
jgi:hypothetical protein